MRQRKEMLWSKVEANLSSSLTYLFNQRLFAFAAFASNLKRFIALYQTCNVILYTTCTYGCVLCVLCMLCLLNCVVE